MRYRGRPVTAAGWRVARAAAAQAAARQSLRRSLYDVLELSCMACT